MPSSESAEATGIHINKVFVIAVLIGLALQDGTRIPRERGTPQGCVISRLLANLFLHYVFACWLSRNWPSIPFARYAEDMVCHCHSKDKAQQVAELGGAV